LVLGKPERHESKDAPVGVRWRILYYTDKRLCAVSRRDESAAARVAPTRDAPAGTQKFTRLVPREQVGGSDHPLQHANIRDGGAFVMAPIHQLFARQRVDIGVTRRTPQGGDSLIVHGPMAFAVDERATRSYARASATTRTAFGRSQRSAA